MEISRAERTAASSRRPSRRRIRGRIGTACARCQKRKIRCDGGTPTCSACQRARTDCMNGVTFRDISQSYISELEARVQWLESIIQENLPDIELYNSGNNHPPEPTASQLDQVKDGGNPIREIADQVGLVSVNTGADLRYLGPSSGLFFTRFVLTGLSCRVQMERSSPSGPTDSNFVPVELLDVHPRELPSDFKQAQWLTQAYFRAVHLQFPFLHEPTHLELLQNVYNGKDIGPADKFQLFMVLAIGATIRSRQTKVLLSAEGYCATAMAHLSSIFQKPSLRGVQSMLLLQMYTINNASSGLNLWALHYNCLANVIELGLHRRAQNSAFTFFEQEMRTRIFWCVYTIDRYLSTLLGRPIGLMDEQCDLRLPHEINDEDLRSCQQIPTRSTATLTGMSSAIHLFKLARFSAEIKCVLYCVDRNCPPYTQPTITDSDHWQEDMLCRLRQWKSEIPRHPDGSPARYLNDLLDIKYYELVMLVVRPSPLFHHSSNALIRQCFHCALECSQLYYRLYVTGMLHYSWIDVQSVFLCVITIFYCVWAPDGVGDQADLDTVLRALKSTSDILSATGEYWLEAKRSRDVLDCISTATVRRFTQKMDATKHPHSRHLVGDVVPSDHSPRPIRSPPIDPGLLSDRSHSFYELGITNTDPSSFPPYYIPAEASTETPDLLSFFAPQTDTSMDFSSFFWDTYPGIADTMPDSGYGDRAHNYADVV
ncbi:fungal-specific transcription factor domain-containing protein [Aspergillus avenaceus]|uniref:Fungal-specific transcription factor domain-containing protein n=1 Tax=Aspergillus avenaceus TaxID=36643 RepID=A0A5N6U3D0_ASPAV|nr:fungal-specific transcription factor domain-containing protein [Aspergillus avenaceus]